MVIFPDLTEWCGAFAEARVSETRTLRFGTCKRDPARLRVEPTALLGHVARFQAEFPKYAAWETELVACAPRIEQSDRAAMSARGVIVQDLGDLTRDL